MNHLFKNIFGILRYTLTSVFCVLAFLVFILFFKVSFGPAVLAIFIEALADAGVLNGLSREEAYLLAEQSLIGTAKMALLSGKHPGAIKDDVCSPGGTTIQGVVTLEEYGFRNAVIKAINASTNHKH